MKIRFKDSQSNNWISHGKFKITKRVLNLPKANEKS